MFACLSLPPKQSLTLKYYQLSAFFHIAGINSARSCLVLNFCFLNWLMVILSHFAEAFAIGPGISKDFDRACHRSLLSIVSYCGICIFLCIFTCTFFSDIFIYAIVDEHLFLLSNLYTAVSHMALPYPSLFYLFLKLSFHNNLFSVFSCRWLYSSLLSILKKKKNCTGNLVLQNAQHVTLLFFLNGKSWTWSYTIPQSFNINT